MLKKNLVLTLLTLALIVSPYLYAEEKEANAVKADSEDTATEATTNTAANPTAPVVDAATPSTTADLAPITALPETPSGIPTISYECNDGASFAVEFGGSEILVVLGGHGVTLTKAPSETGVKYSDGTLSLYIDGEIAKLDEYGETLFTNCKALAG